MLSASSRQAGGWRLAVLRPPLTTALPLASNYWVKPLEPDDVISADPRAISGVAALVTAVAVLAAVLAGAIIMALHYRAEAAALRRRTGALDHRRASARDRSAHARQRDSRAALAQVARRRADCLYGSVLREARPDRAIRSDKRRQAAHQVCSDRVRLRGQLGWLRNLGRRCHERGRPGDAQRPVPDRISQRLLLALSPSAIVTTTRIEPARQLHRGREVLSLSGRESGLSMTATAISP